MNPKSAYKTPTNLRPREAAEVAEWAHDSREYGHNHADWLHELSHVHSRAEFLRRIARAPKPMRGRFPGGDVSDATLAAEIDNLCRKNGLPCPEWVRKTPPAARAWFPFDGKCASVNNAFLRDAPPAFKERNIFTGTDFTLSLRPGRPTKSTVELREKAAERSRNYRQRLLVAAGRKKTEPRH